MASKTDLQRARAEDRPLSEVAAERQAEEESVAAELAEEKAKDSKDSKDSKGTKTAKKDA
jgi:hypothetical protein